MKLSTSLLHAITLGVSISAVAASAVSCEKEDLRKDKKERQDDNRAPIDHPGDSCEACGMG